MKPTVNRNKWKFKLIIFFSLILTYPAWSLSTASLNYRLITEPDAGRGPLIAAIDQAQQQINIVMYLFSDKLLATALNNAAKRGVKVNVLIEKQPYQFASANHSLITHYWKNSKIQWQLVPAMHSSLNFYHQKTMIIDHKQAWIMTLNFTYSSFSKKNITRNFGVLDKNVSDVNKIEAIFEKDWHAKENKLPLLSDNTNVIVSPINTESQLDNLVLSTHHFIKIYAAEIDDKKFAYLLRKLANKGIKVQLIYNTRLYPNMQHILTNSAIALRQPIFFKNHAKAIVIDDQTAYVGSANYTWNAFHHNRELGVIISDPIIVKQLSVQFDHDWDGC